MKKILLLFLVLASARAFCQDSTRVEQYCQLIAEAKVFSTKLNIELDFGKDRKFLAGNNAARELSEKVAKYISVPDALNFMGAEGWTLVSAFPMMSTSGQQEYRFYFKKAFDRTNVLNAENSTSSSK